MSLTYEDVAPASVPDFYFREVDLCDPGDRGNPSPGNVSSTVVTTIIDS